MSDLSMVITVSNPGWGSESEEDGRERVKVQVTVNIDNFPVDVSIEAVQAALPSLPYLFSGLLNQHYDENEVADVRG